MSALRRLLVLALLALAALPAAASAASHMEVGLQDDAVFLDHHYFDSATGYRDARAFHVRWLRLNVVWATTMPAAQAAQKTAPKAVAYDFSKWDRTIDEARSHGISVQLTLTGKAPAWATANHKIGGYKPSAARFGSFVAAAVKHFKGRVYRFSMWNEPNLVSWLSPLSQGPQLYRGLYAAGYNAALRANPHARIFFGETSPYALAHRSSAPLAFFRGVLCVDKRYRTRNRRCPKLKADGVALHPYDARHTPTYRFPGADNVTIGTLSRLTAATDRLQRLGALKPRLGRHMSIYLTEFGYLRAGAKAIPESKRYRYLPQAFAIAQKNSRVRQMLQFQLVQPPAHSPWAFWQSYLVTTTGAGTKTYNWLKAWANQAAARKAITP